MAIHQYQGSLTAQLRYMIGVANFNGMYDAADFLRQVTQKMDGRCRECGSGLVEIDSHMEPILRYSDGDHPKEAPC